MIHHYRIKPRSRRGRSDRGVCRGAVGQAQGAASSAAKMNTRPGCDDWTDSHVYVPGEGWVSWAEMNRCVSEAFTRWVNRKEGRMPMMYGA